MISFITIKYPTFHSAVDGRDSVYDILADTKGTNLSYHS